MKKFKTKRKTKKKKRRIILIIIALSSVILPYLTSTISKETIINILIKANNLSQENNDNNVFLNYLLDYNLNDNKKIESASKENNIDIKTLKKNQTNPIIYIYNTHQTEEYKGNIIAKYDLIPTVMTASYYLRERLNKENLFSIVETTKINEILRTQNWDYSSSYQASRLLIKNAKEKNDTLKYFIDIHRDALAKELSTLTYQEKDYAKVLFVVGTDYQGYEKNLELAELIHEKMNQNIKQISRGILKKGGKGVDGIYNQDLFTGMLLIEIGGEYNKIEEVKRTIDVLSNVLKEVLKNE